MRVPAQLLKAIAAVFVLAMATHSAGLVYYTATFQPPRSGRPMSRRTAIARCQFPGRRAGSGRARRPARRRSLPHRQWSAARHGLCPVKYHRPRRAGDAVALAVQQPNGSEVTTRHSSSGAGDSGRHGGAPITAVRLAALNILSFYPVPFLIVVAMCSRSAIAIATRGSSPYCSRASAPAHGRWISSR